MKPLFLLSGLGLVLAVGCRKDEAPQAPPLEQLRTYDVIPVSAERIAGGYLLECKRALTDPQLAYAQLLDEAGDPSGFIDFALLPNIAENITFRREDLVITDVLPWDQGSFMLLGFGIETDHEDRLHALVYHVNASGQLRYPAMRRYIGAEAELVRSNDLNERYRTRVLGTRTNSGDLVIAARYENDEFGTLRLMRLPIGTSNVPFSIEHRIAPSEELQFLRARSGSDQVMIGFDTPSQTTNESKVLALQSFNFTPLGADFEGFTEVALREARALSVHYTTDGLRVVGSYDAGSDEPRSFMSSGTLIQDITTTTLATPAGRAAIAYAAEPSSGMMRTTYNLFEGGVLAPESERNDRISDLVLADADVSGSLSTSRTILAGQGARALATFSTADGQVIIGALHPYLNAEYLHAFFLVVQD